MPRRRALFGFIVALAAALGTTGLAVESFPMAGGYAQSQVYEGGPDSQIVLPTVLHEVKPQYSAAAMQQKIQGSVWMAVVVDAEGDVTNVRVTRSLDAEYGLDDEATKAMWQWKFKPGTKDGAPVAVQVTVEMTFTLKK